MYCFAADGISIPSSYTSHLAPVATAKLHALVSIAIDKEKVREDVRKITGSPCTLEIIESGDL